MRKRRRRIKRVKSQNNCLVKRGKDKRNQKNQRRVNKRMSRLRKGKKLLKGKNRIQVRALLRIQRKL